MKPTNGIIMKPLLRLPRRSFSTTKVFKGPIDKAFRGVNYGFRLEHESISCLESVVTSRHDFGDKVRTFEGSLLVGADGIFSAEWPHRLKTIMPFSDSNLMRGLFRESSNL
ncbi:MAG: hypothetical protein ALECFALPRED_002543 [Alectoria fallacina]|uniref:Uncharacterized protein n=1 Tax=Alectoria fallacina TaxID=1903189 RepID=A0A8H3FEI2_9LECA|nr:MAG: hypothetical protein ALECFALPRED_002543 [Alectoria fallacina]